MKKNNKVNNEDYIEVVTEVVGENPKQFIENVEEPKKKFHLGEKTKKILKWVAIGAAGTLLAGGISKLFGNGKDSDEEDFEEDSDLVTDGNDDFDITGDYSENNTETSYSVD